MTLKLAKTASRGRGRPCKPSGAPASPEQVRRMQFIERAAMWTGRIGRRAVATTFDISIGHVTNDFQRYRDLAPDNLSYDIGEKCFRPTSLFRPVFEAETSSELLRIIAATTSLPAKDSSRLLGFEIAADAVHPLPVALDEDLLASVCRAVTSGALVKIEYQSMNTPEPVSREFAPHALIFTGQRWLVRGWDGRRGDFRDLALGRILTAKSGSVDYDYPRDALWHEVAAIKIGLAEGLSAGQAEVTAREYGMKRVKGRFSVRTDVRQAMVPYVLDHLRVRPTDSAAKSLPLRLLNYAEIKAYDRPGV
jgi:hypothetical protein